MLFATEFLKLQIVYVKKFIWNFMAFNIGFSCFVSCKRKFFFIIYIKNMLTWELSFMFLVSFCYQNTGFTAWKFSMFHKSLLELERLLVKNFSEYSTKFNHHIKNQFKLYKILHTVSVPMVMWHIQILKWSSCLIRFTLANAL